MNESMPRYLTSEVTGDHDSRHWRFMLREQTVIFDKGKQKGNPHMDYVLQGRATQFRPPNQTEPTSAKPGSMEKLSVMAERYRAGQPLHDPNDATCFDRRGRARTILDIFHQRVSRP